MMNVGLEQAYAQAYVTPAPERRVDSIAELRGELGVLARQDVETMLVGKHSVVELDIACIETENRRQNLIKDKQGVNVSRAKNLYDRELELDRLDVGLKLHELRNNHVNAIDDQEQADERLAALQPDLDLVAAVRDKQKELTRGYHRKSKIFGGVAALLVSLAVAYGAKDESEAEALAVIPIAAAAGVGLGESVARATYKGRAHSLARPKYEYAEANTVVLEKYVG